MVLQWMKLDICAFDNKKICYQYQYQEQSIKVL